MNGKHTPEPWRVDYLDKNSQRVISGPYFEIATLWHHCVGSIEREMESNAARIVACVNACADVDSDALAELPGGLAGLLDMASRVATERKALRQQRDSLAAALLEASRALMVYEGLPRDRFPGPPTTALRMARAALAKLDGGS